MIKFAWLSFASVFFFHNHILEASYQCGIRKHSRVSLIYSGWKVEEGQWPWHVGLFLKKNTTSSFEYACGGTLVSEKHVLTAAHCVVNSETRYPLPTEKIELHLGQRDLSIKAYHVQIRDVSRVYVHPEHSTHRSDIAVLVMRLPVEYTDFIIPICMDQRADRDLRNLEGRRGWITGWGTTEKGSISHVLRAISMPVVSYIKCLNDDDTFFGDLLNPTVFCAGDRNGTSPGTGDSGGGMFFSDGDRWVLRGIVSFANVDEATQKIDTSKYAVFVNVQHFLTWIREIMTESKPKLTSGLKRISEKECDRFRGLTNKRTNGFCSNSRYPHTVYVVVGGIACSGILVNENHVITACQCTGRFPAPGRVELESYAKIDILNITCHPQYNARSLFHDLAIVELEKSVILSSSLIPACLANIESENLYDTLVQTSFGHKKQTAIKTFVESDENRIITNEECKRVGLEQIQEYGLSSNQLCAINSDKLRTVTDGSAGGPLQSVNRQSCLSTVVGVASYGGQDDEEIRKSNKTVVDVYSRVAHYLDWIEEVVWNVKSPTTKTWKVERKTTTYGNRGFVFSHNRTGK